MPAHLQSWDVLPASVVLRVCGTSTCGGAHTILVVFAHEDDGKFPERCHVDSFKELALCTNYSIARDGWGEVYRPVVARHKDEGAPPCSE